MVILGKSRSSDWVKGKRIGKGGQTIVYMATNETFGSTKQYVLKSLKKHMSIERFKNDIAARKSLSHSNIVQIEDSNLSNKPPFIIEEYFEDGHLAANRQYFEKQPLNALKLFRQLCDAIAEAHNKKVIHRDLKPENILYRASDNTVHVTDFGICFVEGRERATVIKEQVGSRYYICPEMEKGKRLPPTERCDIYSLGKLLYWMLSGKIFSREEHRDKEYDLAKPRHNDKLEQVNRLLDSMIVEDPGGRYHSVGKVIEELDDIIMILEKGKNVIGGNIDQDCIYCGKGNYIDLVRYDPLGNTTDKQVFLAKASQFAHYGFAINGSAAFHLLLTCTYCGNMQLFKRDTKENPWSM